MLQLSTAIKLKLILSYGIITFILQQLHQNAITQTLQLHGKYLHITDIHLDDLYKPLTEIFEYCHRGIGNVSPYGEISSCDSPFELVDFYMNFSKKLVQHNKIDFVVWTGDNSRHDYDPEDPLNFDEVQWASEVLTNLMIKTFGKSIPIIPTIGNNDVFPHNQISDFNQSNNTIYFGLSQAYKSLLNSSQIKQFQRQGNIAVQIKDKLIVLSLNTILFMFSDIATDSCLFNNSGGYQQLMWLEQWLQFSKETGQRVLIIGHVPPLLIYYYISCHRLYEEITNKYQDVIIGHQFGHHHADQFYIINYTNNSNQTIQKSSFLQQQNSECGVGVAFLVPSLMPTYNPSIRLVQYNKNFPFELLNYTQYYTDLVQCISEGQLSIQEEYRFPESYGLPDMSINSFCKLQKAIQQGNNTMSQLYEKYQWVSGIDKYSIFKTINTINFDNIPVSIELKIKKQKLKKKKYPGL